MVFQLFHNNCKVLQWGWVEALNQFSRTWERMNSWSGGWPKWVRIWEVKDLGCLLRSSRMWRREIIWDKLSFTYVTLKNLRRTFSFCAPGCFGYGASSDERPMKSYKLISTTIFIVLLPDPRFRSRCSWNPVDGRKNFQNCQRCNAIFCTLQYSSLIKLDLLQCKILTCTMHNVD